MSSLTYSKTVTYITSKQKSGHYSFSEDPDKKWILEKFKEMHDTQTLSLGLVGSLLSDYDVGFNGDAQTVISYIKEESGT